MHWTSIVWILLYLAVGWMLSELVEDRGDAAKMTVFITWPVIIAFFALSTIVTIFVGLVLAVMKLLYKEKL